MDWPPQFICPISKTVMADPVIVSSGHSYERRCLDAWFNLGQTRCVKQGTFLDRSVVVPNVAIRTSIMDFAKARRMRTFPMPPSPDFAFMLAKRLIAELQGALVNSDEEDESREVAIEMLQESDPRHGTARHVRAATDSAVEGFRVSSDEQEGYAVSDGRDDEIAPSNLSCCSQSPSALIGLQSNQQVPPPLETKPCSHPSSEAPSRTPPSSTAVEAPVMDSLLRKLLQSFEAVGEQEAATAELRQLTRGLAVNRTLLCRVELLQALLPLLQLPNPIIQVNGVAALVNFSLEKPNKITIVRAGAIPYLIHVLNHGVPEAQEHAAGAVFSLALCEENRHPFGVLGAIPPLIDLLHYGTPSSRQDAALALYQLSLAKINRSKLVKVGAVPILLLLAQARDRLELASRSLHILGNVAAIPEGQAALLELNAIFILVKLLSPARDDKRLGISEQAAAVLLLLAKGNFRFKSMALQAGAREPLTALADCGTPRAKTKALALLEIIKESSYEDDDGEDLLYCRQFVRKAARSGQANSSGF